jgi:four helix bundle protein
MVGYRRLVVRQKADELAFQVYAATSGFPKEEIYGLTSQLRRAALSVPTNIAEGHGRQGRKELKQFLRIALGSLSEVEYLLSFALRLCYLSADKYESLERLRAQVGRLLWGLEEATKDEKRETCDK